MTPVCCRRAAGLHCFGADTHCQKVFKQNCVPGRLADPEIFSGDISAAMLAVAAVFCDCVCVNTCV